MPNKLLYIIRHGETEFNRRGVVQGSGIDAPLNELGRAQARAFYQAYKDYDFEKVYYTTLQRTRQTVEPFLATGVQHEALAGLNEISWGEKEGTAISQDDATYYRYMTDQWASGNFDFAIPGGESPVQVQQRQQPALEHILQQPEEKVLVCMHGRAMRILLAWTTGAPLSEMDTFEHTNTGLYVLEYANETFHIAQRNEVSHLADLHA